MEFSSQSLGTIAVNSVTTYVVIGALGLLLLGILTWGPKYAAPKTAPPPCQGQRPFVGMIEFFTDRKKYRSSSGYHGRRSCIGCKRTRG